jgi:putative (di)nucleoside polyphosphate hydrolase
MPNAQVFRANVGVIVVNPAGEVLALQRRGMPGAWQLPQGGLDQGEEPRAAAERELEEETGLSATDLEWVGEHPRWLAYELPPEARSKRTGRGQVQKWFVYRAASTPEVDLSRAADDEFDAVRWMPMRELIDATWPVRRDVYRQLLEHFEAALGGGA